MFNFTAKVVPDLLSEVLNRQGWHDDDVDFYLMHQENRFMLDFLRNKIGIKSEKMLMNIERFGNTSSASIPLLLSEFGDLFILKQRKNFYYVVLVLDFHEEHLL
ncbi:MULTISPECIES: 3-oxoacyl-[acyl-carrier-protein] synthase III C-terminal domain-containing protein [Paenibacillus]|uniref:3-oxoacyl-[acyl-carrier-protein] synthase III C-terminal domain-containing protein n=1 Tax=Paenibacillus TaxID=44249 RepID=UPI000C9FBBDF|nr:MULTISPECIES: 3-oxoacyl-[acyl-carrier-protein] synthase III C-terminal domain-containing protein [Paenibacillus]MDY7991537.1 3-oxoacyl-[acyl-carrier-protein] synthase III C-terminal domain-containing protein [Paenibacillus polymyxa]MDY8117978.1 3-oxoacyl-[acyl-carrier-protein] synthase III C-terminal domain-containing protein [Paenibacillus polymyxa]PNQ82573.1 hypothetical protein C1T21_04990 [Paenibacillus sp. F4]